MQDQQSVLCKMSRKKAFAGETYAISTAGTNRSSFDVKGFGYMLHDTSSLRQNYAGYSASDNMSMLSALRSND